MSRRTRLTPNVRSRVTMARSARGSSGRMPSSSSPPADEADENRNQHQRAPVAGAPTKERESGIAAQHVEIAVREIDDVEQAENHGQAQCHERKRHADDQRIDDLGQDDDVEITEKVFHRRSSRSWSSVQNFSHLSGPTAFSPGTFPTVWKSFPLTLTTTISTIAWWSPLRIFFVPCGVSQVASSIAPRSFCSSVLPAFSMARLKR